MLEAPESQAPNLWFLPEVSVAAPLSALAMGSRPFGFAWKFPGSGLSIQRSIGAQEAYNKKRVLCGFRVEGLMLSPFRPQVQLLRHFCVLGFSHALNPNRGRSVGGRNLHYVDL